MQEERYDGYSRESGEEQSGGSQGGKRESFWKGAFAGVLVSALLLVGGAGLYCRVTGSRLIIGKSRSHLVTDNEILDSETVDKIEELTDYMDLYYYEEFDKKDIQNSLYAGVLEGLGDPYSVYYTAEQFADQQVSTSGVYYGIGAALRRDSETKRTIVSKVYEGTPAEEAGILNDDIILSVNGIDASSVGLSELVQKIRGEEGTTVHLQIYRSSVSKTFEFDVERKNVQLPSVTGQMMENGIGYIQISEFQKKTGEQFSKMVEELGDQGMTSMIVDLRDNPGGMLSTVVQILDEILPEGLVVYTQDKYGEKQEFRSDKSCLKYPMAVLINGNSASASEIFAGAIKDYSYGTLIGTKTFGKGIVQTILPLEDGDAIKLTTSKYYTPNGNYIHGVGIEPDIELEYKFLGGEDEQYDRKYDNQIQKAIEVLKGEATKDK